MKQTYKPYSRRTKLYLKLLVVQLLLILTSTKLSAQTYSFEFKQTSFSTVIAEITNKTNYQFVFDSKYLKQAKPVTLTINESGIKQILDAVFKNQPFEYTLSENTIVIVPQKAFVKE